MATPKKASPPGAAAMPVNRTSKSPVSKRVNRTSSAKEKNIRYEDKSAGQPELVPIFNNIKGLLEPYAKGSIKVKGEQAGIYNLVIEKRVERGGKQADELYFASIIIQKGYVGFYFTPVYDADDPQSMFHPELLKALKGKTCFHIKKDDPKMFGYINDALKAGYDSYKQKGWI